MTTATTTAKTMNLYIFVSRILIDYYTISIHWLIYWPIKLVFYSRWSLVIVANLLVFPIFLVRVNIDLINRNTTYLLELDFKRHYHENAGQLSYKSLQNQLFLWINLSNDMEKFMVNNLEHKNITFLNLLNVWM